jgi:hypothetical protein
LIRVIQEIKPPMIETKKLADCLAHVHHYYWQHDARAALQDVIVQLHRREARIHVGFDSESGAIPPRRGAAPSMRLDRLPA